MIPPEATAGILLFFLVIFIEPLQRALGKALRESAQRELDVAQRLIAEMRQEAKNGEFFRLTAFIERQLVKQLGLRSARLEMADSSVPTVRPTMEVNHELEASHQLATSNQSSQPESEEKRAAIPFDAREFAIMQD